MEQEQRQLIKKYIDLFLRRKKLVIICVMIAFVGGIASYLKFPKRYKATSLIIFQHKNINLSKMSLDVKTKTREIVSTLTQQVTSRSSLEKIIKQFGLYEKSLQRLPMEDVISNMRKNINIIPAKGDVFQVEFIGSIPKKVMLVTNALAAKFIEENLRFREEKASETSEYVKDELQMSKATLDEKEELMRDYKLKYYNEMPQQLTTNMARLNSLQIQLQSNNQGQRDLERTKILIQDQISIRVEAITKSAIMAGQLNEAKGVIEPSNTELQTSMTGLLNKRDLSAQEADLLRSFRELESLRSTYKDFTLKYTSKHPEVKRLTRILADKEREHAKLVILVQQSDIDQDVSLPVGILPTKKSPNLSMADASNQQLQQLQLQIQEVTFNIKSLKESEKKILANIEIYKNWISSAPVREAEWTALTRNYEQLNQHYQELVSRSITAESAQTLERRQKGSQFKIVDSAHLPEKPFTPDFLKIMLLSLALGCGVGGGAALFLETVQTSFKDAMDLESYLDVPVVCSIPFIQISREKKEAKIKLFSWWFAFIIVSAAIFLGTAYLWQKGMIIV